MTAEHRELDLHGVRARDARAHVVRFVASVRLSAPGSSVRVVTGLGLHSTASPVLHRLVRQMLEASTVPHVASWSVGPDGGSFILRLTGSAAGPPGRRGEPSRRAADAALTDREWYNARRLEYARRRAEREQAATAESAAESSRLAALRIEFGGTELPEWLCVPPAAVTEARAARAREEEADRIEYGMSRAEFDARLSRGRPPRRGT